MVGLVRSTMIRVWVADDHPVVIEGIKRHLGLLDDMEFAGSSTSLAMLEEALTGASDDIDVVVLDIQMPGVGERGDVQRLVRRTPARRVILFSLREEDERVADLVSGGASAFVSKTRSIGELASVIREVHRGREVISDTLRAMADNLTAAPHTQLTEREQEVFYMLARCLSPKEIAFEMGVSQSTVYTHADRVRKKPGVASLAEVVSYARRWGVDTSR